MLFLLFQNAIFYTIALSPLGRVAEWLNAAVLKTADAQAFVGSNPTPSAKILISDSLKTSGISLFSRHLIEDFSPKNS